MESATPQLSTDPRVINLLILISRDLVIIILDNKSARPLSLLITRQRTERVNGVPTRLLLNRRNFNSSRSLLSA